MIRRQWFSTPMGDDHALLREASAIISCEKPSTDLELLEVLRAVCDERGTNLATALLYQYLNLHKQHGAFIKNVKQQNVNQSKEYTPIHMVVVPGMFASRNPELGGDGAVLTSIASAMGFSVSKAPTNDLASISENAGVLHEYLQSLSYDNLWLVSISRGSADVRYMLTHYDTSDYEYRLRHWVSVSGIVAGSPLIEGLSQRPVFTAFVKAVSKLQGISTNLAQELDREHPHWSIPHSNPSFSITHVMPVPMDWHLTSPVLSRYSKIRHLGPTDGLSLLADTLKGPGNIYPIWGADHMLRVPNLSDHFYRLIHFLRKQS